MRLSSDSNEPQAKGQPARRLRLRAVEVGLAALLIGSLAGLGRWRQAAPASPAKAVPAAQTLPKENPALTEFKQVIQPILEDRCYDCHGDGESRDGVAFDTLTTEDQILKNPDLWLKVIKNTRAHIMPPPGNDPPTAAEQRTLEKWIKYGAFGLNPAQPDPGRVTVHRLNRVEYQNTIRDLMGVDFETQAEFPGDDSGYGFDNIADVLNMSPLLMEKYLAAAQTIVDQAVPTVTRVLPQLVADVGDFQYPDGSPTAGTNIRASGIGANGIPAIKLTYIEAASISHVFKIKQAGDYRLVLEQNLRGDFVYNPQQSEITVAVDGKPVSKKKFGWESNQDFSDSFPVHWEPGDHTLAVALDPVLPLPPKVRGAKDDNQYNFKKARLEGPLEKSQWVHPPNYARFFSRDDVPADAAHRRAYAKEILGAFATKAFRRPVPADSLAQLVDMAEKTYEAPGATFEVGIAHAMVAILASPRFLFRVEAPVAAARGPFAQVDEYTLASRLSYFLWSTMPDDELIKLAAAGHLRANLGTQVKRMLADPRSAAFVENFTGQWLQTRLVATVPLDPHEILARQGLDLYPQFTDGMREALRQEPEKDFEYVVRENRSVDEFLTSDYIFINETLANIYQIGGVTGPEFRKVTLPAGDWRGGLLTTGSVLMVTSNPTRTSPVKRGKWMLDNILGSPTPPPPPNIPALEDSAAKVVAAHAPTLRETLAVHRKDALCASCHDRMDPIGLALENFSALGQWRNQDLGQPIDASGKLPTGESFADIRQLKQILATGHKAEFYRCLTEKLLTYAVGRGMEYYDVPTVDKIVADLDRDHGAFSTLLMGVIDSAPFQMQRTNPSLVPDANTATPRLTQNDPPHEPSALP